MAKVRESTGLQADMGEWIRFDSFLESGMGTLTEVSWNNRVT